MDVTIFRQDCITKTILIHPYADFLITSIMDVKYHVIHVSNYYMLGSASVSLSN